MSIPTPPPPRFNIAAYALQHAEARPDRLALRFADAALVLRDVTYRNLLAQTMCAAGALRAAGVQRGDHVFLRARSTPELASAVLGTLALGAVAIPSSADLTPEEAGFIVDDAEARFLVQDSGLPSVDAPEGCRVVPLDALRIGPALASFEDTAADEPALLVYTSGTTSRPKGVLHGHRMAWGRRPMRDGWTGIGESDVVLHAGKLNWTYTLGLALIDALAAGGTAVLHEGPNDPQVWPRLAAASGATVFAAVPSVYRQILKYNDDLRSSFSTLRHGLTAGEPLPERVRERWREAVGTPLFEALGMSECSTYVSTGPDVPVRHGSPGKPQRGRRVAVLPIDGGTQPLNPNEVGLLAIHRSDPGLMLGYWKRPEEEAAVYRGEWFIGGDLARFDDDGYVWFEGRNNDLMNAFGYRVSPLEVEREIGALTGVTAFALGEREVADDVRVICLYAVCGPNAPEDDALLATCAERVAAYKRPRAVVRCDALPRSANGKLLRPALAALPARD